MAWIKLHSQLLDSEVFASEKGLKIWVWLILKARRFSGFVPIQIGSGQSIVELKRGQLLFGRFSAEEKLGINGSTIYKWLKRFQELGMIDIESSSHSTTISIVNYDLYNEKSNSQVTAEPPPPLLPHDSQVTATSPPPPSPSNTKKERKKERREEGEKEREGESKEKKPQPHLFENSEFFELQKFAMQIELDEKYKCFDLDYYHESIKNWSAGGKTKLNWIATAKNWMLRDLKENKAKLKPEYQNQIKQQSKDDFDEQLKEIIRREQMVREQKRYS